MYSNMVRRASSSVLNKFVMFRWGALRWTGARLAATMFFFHEADSLWRTTMKTASLLPLLAAATLAVGCATRMTITSNPPGAVVYSRGSGRAAYRWELKGPAPVSYKSWYSAEKSFVTWPDGTRSEVRRTPLQWKKQVEVEFIHPQQAQRAPGHQ
jgi:hypothetical protein